MSVTGADPPLRVGAVAFVGSMKDPFGRLPLAL
jgi:hypothetical protein